MGKDARALTIAILAALVLTWFAHALSRSTAPLDVVWSLTLWGSALLASLLMLRAPRSLGRALAVWCAALPLATLADGAARLPIYALIASAYLFGLASLSGAPLYLPSIIVTRRDVERLTRLLSRLPAAQREAARALAAELSRAEVVAPSAVPSDVVTMNSRVVFEELDSGRRAEAVLVYPQDSGDDAEGISILAPIGSALLGLRSGQSIDWRMPSGVCKRIRVLRVVYQPEAAGHFDL